MTRGKRVRADVVRLTDMRDRLQAIQHYDNPDEAFDILLYSFAKHEELEKDWKCRVIRTGHMSYFFATKFAEYCGYPIHKRC